LSIDAIAAVLHKPSMFVLFTVPVDVITVCDFAVPLSIDLELPVASRALPLENCPSDTVEMNPR
jgi:hypothetical protein